MTNWRGNTPPRRAYRLSDGGRIDNQGRERLYPWGDTRHTYSTNLAYGGDRVYPGGGGTGGIPEAVPFPASSPSITVETGGSIPPPYSREQVRGTVEMDPAERRRREEDLVPAVGVYGRSPPFAESGGGRSESAAPSAEAATHKVTTRFISLSLSHLCVRVVDIAWCLVCCVCCR